MIIVRLRGGLGNQLFQYAAGKALALRHGTELRLDLYTYKKHPYRRFELGPFQIDAGIATREEVHRYTGSNPIIRYLNKRDNYFRCPKVFAQPHYHFYRDFFSLPSDIYLSGYWQSEQYFLSYETEIRKQFTTRAPADAQHAEWVRKLQDLQSVAVHVRRGDYNSAGYSGFFGGLTPEYYTKAIERMQSLVTQPSFYFFSDDPVWCRQTFGHLPAEFVSHNQGTDAYKDLLLMSACRHQIIANSTFSWWGAWLNTNPEKHVMAPAKWFRENWLTKKEPVYPSRYYNTEDLIPSGWQKI